MTPWLPSCAPETTSAAPTRPRPSRHSSRPGSARTAPSTPRRPTPNGCGCAVPRCNGSSATRRGGRARSGVSVPFHCIAARACPQDLQRDVPVVARGRPRPGTGSLIGHPVAAAAAPRVPRPDPAGRATVLDARDQRRRAEPWRSDAACRCGRLAFRRGQELGRSLGSAIACLADTGGRAPARAPAVTEPPHAARAEATGMAQRRRARHTPLGRRFGGPGARHRAR